MLAFALLLTGCAPRYIVKTQYIPPADPNAKICVDRCLNKKNSCEMKCDRSYNDCLSMAFNRAEDVKRVADLEYRKSYDEYISKLDTYNYHMRIWQNSYDQNSRDWRYFHKRCKKHADKYACKRCREIKLIVDNLLKNRPQRPIPPAKPDFDRILLKQQNMCRKDCGCQSDYDVCFTSCGGEIVLHKICVENCDQKR